MNLLDLDLHYSANRCQEQAWGRGVRVGGWQWEVAQASVTRFVALHDKNTPCGVPRYCKSLLLSVCYNGRPIMFALDLFISNSTSTHLVWLQLSVCYNDMLWYASTHLVWLQLSVCYNDMLWYASTHLVWLQLSVCYNDMLCIHTSSLVAKTLSVVQKT